MKECIQSRIMETNEIDLNTTIQQYSFEVSLKEIFERIKYSGHVHTLPGDSAVLCKPQNDTINLISG